MPQKAESLKELLLNLVFPEKCVFCGRLLTRQEKAVCDSCSVNLPEPKEAVPTDRWFKSCSVPFSYEGNVKSSIGRFKFSGRSFYAETYAMHMTASVVRSGVQAQIVTWVPVSRIRKRQRGYDQSELLARQMAALLGLPCEKLLTKKRQNRTQHGLNAEERAENVRNVYLVKESDRISGKEILLVDDIITTGATMSECSRMLMQAGASGVHAAALAFTPKKM